ncbi:hypothetical protein WKI68_02615 [Streptomyces sp. MS1.HAVA.3]|uniref:Transposase n=1 Tax=Streptomyces caledonius TaxID=3134107 RepID=A0ABU8TYD2_9ACTN
MTSIKPSASDPAPKPKRRSFSPRVQAADRGRVRRRAKNEKGAVLRRERPYHSHVRQWRAARNAEALETLVDRRTSAAQPKKSAVEMENEKLRRQVERLEKELAREKGALEVTGKASALLETISESAD